MKTAGVDISTSTGLSLVGDGEDRGRRVHFADYTGFQRVRFLAAEVLRILSIWQPSLIVVEAYAIGHVSSVVTVVEVGTAIKLGMWDAGYSWFEVPPSVLKKWATGKGNATKQYMGESIKKNYGFSSPCDDVVDAYALAQMGQLGPDRLLKIKGIVYQKNNKQGVEYGNGNLSA